MVVLNIDDNDNTFTFYVDGRESHPVIRLHEFDEKKL